jgi:hypothetical protein
MWKQLRFISPVWHLSTRCEGLDLIYIIATQLYNKIDANGVTATYNLTSLQSPAHEHAIVQYAPPFYCLSAAPFDL